MIFLKRGLSIVGTAGKARDLISLDIYTTFPWEALCAEVAKLQVQRHECGQLSRLPLASGEKENPGTPDGARGPCYIPCYSLPESSVLSGRYRVEAAGIEPAAMG
jgi:hypothetical protein